MTSAFFVYMHLRSGGRALAAVTLLERDMYAALRILAAQPGVRSTTVYELSSPRPIWFSTPPADRN